MSAYDFIAADKKLEPLEIGVEDKGYASIDDVRWVFGDDSRKHPRGLKIFKWKRGKK